jgi:hypothetical protein
MRSRGACPPQRNYLTGLLLCFCLTTLLDGSLSSQQSPAATAPSTSPAQAQPGALPEAKPVQSSGQTKDDASQTGDSTKATSNDRLFFALPNFLTLENSANVPPLTVGQKFKVVARSSFDPVQFVWYGFLAGISQAQDSEPGYGQGRRGLCQALRGSRAKEFDLSLPLLESVLHSNSEHVSRAVDAILRSGKKKVSVLGLSFKAGTDDLRESPQVQLIKRLLGEGCQVQVWDRDVSLGRLAGSNRQYIDEVIPHIGSLLSTDLEQIVRSAEVVVIGTKFIDRNHLKGHLNPSQTIIDLVNLDSSRRG